MERVVVTGIGALTPIGNNVQDYWQALLNGFSGAEPITKFDTAKFMTRINGKTIKIFPMRIKWNLFFSNCFYLKTGSGTGKKLV